jgi:hypothetical protein
MTEIWFRPKEEMLESHHFDSYGNRFLARRVIFSRPEGFATHEIDSQGEDSGC